MRLFFNWTFYLCGDCFHNHTTLSKYQRKNFDVFTALPIYCTVTLTVHIKILNVRNLIISFLVLVDFLSEYLKMDTEKNNET